MGMFLCENHLQFWTFLILNFEKSFLKSQILFSKYPLLVERTMTHFHTKPPCQKPILRQIQHVVQNGPPTKARVLPPTTLFFWKFNLSIRTSFE